jgi:hypothetical protein
MLALVSRRYLNREKPFLPTGMLLRFLILKAEGSELLAQLRALNPNKRKAINLDGTNHHSEL